MRYRCFFMRTAIVVTAATGKMHRNITLCAICSVLVLLMLQTEWQDGAARCAPATNLTAMSMVQIVLVLEVDGKVKHARAAVEVGVVIWVLLMQKRYQGRRENAGKA